MPTKSKSRTTTKRANQSARALVHRRLPTEIPPVGPGEMLLEEFLRPLGCLAPGEREDARRHERPTPPFPRPGVSVLTVALTLLPLVLAAAWTAVQAVASPSLRPGCLGSSPSRRAAEPPSRLLVITSPARHPLSMRFAWLPLSIVTLTAGATLAAAQAPARSAASDSAAKARARADSVRLPYTTADVEFMTHMISHHAQAIVMAKMAPSHGASAAVQTLSGRIINAQNDEITLMQNWLRDRNQPVPAVPHAKPMPMTMTMGGEKMEMLMPGMLTDAQMRALDAARGITFDTLFLRGMIQHHQGAISMVQQLFATPGAGQDEAVFKFANNVNVDQITEIRRMQQMLLREEIESHNPQR